MAEAAFYHRNPKLKRVSIHKFEPAEKIARLLGITQYELLYRAAESRDIHGIVDENRETFTLHPSVWKFVGKRYQKSFKRFLSAEGQSNQK